MQQDKKKTILNITIHFIFWIGICFVFTNYSFLRPLTINSIYKEIICVCFIVIMVYINYLFLIPRYFQRGKVKLYWLLATFTILLAGFCEFWLVKVDISICYSRSLPPEAMSNLFRTALTLIITRDFCFFLFFFIYKIYQDISDKYLKEKQTVAKETQAVYITPTNSNYARKIMINDIVYISHIRNYTYFYLIDGSKIEQYSSLSNVEQTFPKNTCVKINKANLVIISNITNYNVNVVEMNLKIDDISVILHISQNYSKSVLPVLKKYVEKKNSNNFDIGEVKNNTGEVNSKKQEDYECNYDEIGVISGENDKENASKIPNIKLNAKTNEVFLFIRAHNGCQKSTINEALGYPLKSIEKYIDTLKYHKLVEFRGAPKTGGYYVIEKDSTNEEVST
ncbi:LytTR family transcriptional regulator DNA-binding domain-containing protein [Bacteroidales bacterium OttesenSCG-928-K22]|nr:LytTR family transcriptional regulator DNA-binding domain-containing protein [Bacteroidales bacterium OttesenSCG-928-L14]MDL2240199.1 LytTR family transcriptional regulator DNA-binding domain-containing protein [Bacteroidales bacterium OttesenSCG-928-K22]